MGAERKRHDWLALWARKTMNTDWSSGPLARPFARSLALLTRSLAPDCSLRSRPPLHSLARSLTHFANSLARGTVNDKMAIYSLFFSFWPIVHNHSTHCGESESRECVKGHGLSSGRSIIVGRLVRCQGGKRRLRRTVVWKKQE